MMDINAMQSRLKYLRITSEELHRSAMTRGTPVATRWHLLGAADAYTREATKLEADLIHAEHINARKQESQQ